MRNDLQIYIVDRYIKEKLNIIIIHELKVNMYCMIILFQILLSGVRFIVYLR